MSELKLGTEAAFTLDLRIMPEPKIAQQAARLAQTSTGLTDMKTDRNFR
jgi:hypothetical protein